MLYPNPNARPKHGKNQSQSTTSGPQQKQAQQSKDCGHTIENYHYLPVRHPTLQKLVVNVLTISAEDGAAADQSAYYRKRSFEDRQSERNHWNRHGNDG